MLSRFVKFLIFFMIFFSFFSCGGDGSEKKIDVLVDNSASTKKNEREEILTFKDIEGTWKLDYEDDYGYIFKFYKNYRSTIVLFLSNSSLVFRGVYNIEDGNMVRINVSEMKRMDSTKNLNLTSDFVKTNLSHFVFHGRVCRLKGKVILEFRPVRIFIDGNNSEGFFEPFIKLKRISL